MNKNKRLKNKSYPPAVKFTGSTGPAHNHPVKRKRNGKGRK